MVSVPVVDSNCAVQSIAMTMFIPSSSTVTINNTILISKWHVASLAVSSNQKLSLFISDSLCAIALKLARDILYGWTQILCI